MYLALPLMLAFDMIPQAVREAVGAERAQALVRLETAARVRQRLDEVRGAQIDGQLVKDHAVKDASQACGRST